MIYQVILYFALAGIFTKLYLNFQEEYIRFEVEDGDDPRKYYQQANAVMEDTIYVTNPESLYAGFSLEAGNTKQKIPFGPITDRLGNVREVPGLPNRDVLYPIRDDANLVAEKLPSPGSRFKAHTDAFPF